MARQPRRRDWQERAFEERENRRRDDSVGVPSDLPDPNRISTDLPRRSSLRWTAVGLGAILVAVLIRSGLNNRAPSLTTSCTTPAIALSTTHTHQDSTVRWSATGPSGSHLLITIGVASFVPGANPGQLHPVPEAGRTINSTEVAVRPGVLGGSCKAHGSFNVGVPKGTYTVGLFTIANSGTAQAAATSVATKPLTVS